MKIGCFSISTKYFVVEENQEKEQELKVEGGEISRSRIQIERVEFFSFQLNPLLEFLKITLKTQKGSFMQFL